MENREDVRHIMMLSGGKDSTALALYMRDKHPELPFEYVFCDTHKELPETYEYLARIEAYLGQPVTRLLSGEGERGFDHYLKVYGGYLPSAQMRWCTRLLKIEPFEKYVKDDPTVLYVGIRADEKRSGYISTKENIRAVFPFKEDGLNSKMFSESSRRAELESRSTTSGVHARVAISVFFSSEGSGSG